MDNNDLHTDKESCIKACCTVICITARQDYVPKAPHLVLQEEMLEKQNKINFILSINNLSKINEDKINLKISTFGLKSKFSFKFTTSLFFFA